MTEDELQAGLERTTPEGERYELFVEDAQDQDVRVRFSPPKGEDWSMAALLAVTEISLRAAAGPHTRVSHLNGTRIPDPQGGDLIALSRGIPRGRGGVHPGTRPLSHPAVGAVLGAPAERHRLSARA